LTQQASTELPPFGPLWNWAAVIQEAFVDQIEKGVGVETVEIEDPQAKALFDLSQTAFRLASYTLALIDTDLKSDWTYNKRGKKGALKTIRTNVRIIEAYIKRLRAVG